MYVYQVLNTFKYTLCHIPNYFREMYLSACIFRILFENEKRFHKFTSEKQSGKFIL